MTKRISYLKPTVLAFSAFQVLFYALMWISKTAHILFFEKSGAMFTFGAAYSAMALVGYFSFVVGYLADTYGFRKVLLSGGALYSIGLLMRIYSVNLPVAIVSGLIAGAGASCILCAVRIWMLELSTEETTAQMVGVKSATSSFGTAIGCALAGMLPTLFPSDNALQAILIFAGVGMAVLTVIFYFKGPKIDIARSATRAEFPLKNIRNLFRDFKGLSSMTLILGVTTGFYVSFISPYLPVIMKDKGLSLLSIGISTGAFALIRFFIDPFIGQFVEKKKDQSLQIFLMAEILIALITASLLWSISKEAFVLLLVFRSASLGLSAIAEEVLWIRTFPKNKMGLFFGLSQSGFFLGDFFGGLANGYLYKKFGLDSCIWIVLAIMLCNAILFVMFFRRKTSTVVALIEEVPC
jgi:MFS family permease